MHLPSDPSVTKLLLQENNLVVFHSLCYYHTNAYMYARSLWYTFKMCFEFVYASQ